MEPNIEPVVTEAIEPIDNTANSVSLAENLINPIIPTSPKTVVIDGLTYVQVTDGKPISPIIPEINMLTGKPIDATKQRHFLAAFFFSFLFGVFGIDRFYLGKYWTGILKLLTFGGMGVWALIDLNLIMSGNMRDAQGNKLLEAARYKKLAHQTIFIFTILAIALVTLFMASVSYVTMQFMQSDGIDKLLNSAGGGNYTQILDQYQSLNL